MLFPDVIRDIILDYASSWQLLLWIDINEISWFNLAVNRHPHAAALLIDSFNKDPDGANGTDLDKSNENPFMWPWLREHPNFINKLGLMRNPHPDAWEYTLSQDMPVWKLDSDELSSLPHAIPWLQEHREYISWSGLCENPGAKDLIMTNQNGIDWRALSTNPAPWAISLLERAIMDDIKTRNFDHEGYPKRLYKELSANPAGFDLLLKLAPLIHEDGISEVVDYAYLSANSDPRAVILSLENKWLIDWTAFSKNPSATKYLHKWKHKIDWTTLSENPGIFITQHPAGVRKLL
jgi:hypothetical protein